MTASTLLSTLTPATAAPIEEAESEAPETDTVSPEEAAGDTDSAEEAEGDTDTEQPVPLEGEELLAFLRNNQHLQESESIKATGYFKFIKGKPRLNRARYFKAISIANGFAPAKPERKPRGETGPRGVLKVGPNGLIPVGLAYSRILKLVPGNYVSVYEDQGVLVIDPTTDEAKAAEAEAQAKAASAKAEAPSEASKPEKKTKTKKG